VAQGSEKGKHKVRRGKINKTVRRENRDRKPASGVFGKKRPLAKERKATGDAARVWGQQRRNK